MAQDISEGFDLIYDPALSFDQMLAGYVALEQYYRAVGATTPLPCNIVIDESRTAPRGEVEEAINQHLSAEYRAPVLGSLEALFPRQKWGFSFPVGQVMRYLQDNALEQLIASGKPDLRPGPYSPPIDAEAARAKFGTLKEVRIQPPNEKVIPIYKMPKE